MYTYIYTLDFNNCPIIRITHDESMKELLQNYFEDNILLRFVENKTNNLSGGSLTLNRYPTS